MESNLSYVLFDRLNDMYGDSVKRMLSTQYRMNQKITQFTAQELYENSVIPHDSVSQHLLPDLPNVATDCQLPSYLLFSLILVIQPIIMKSKTAEKWKNKKHIKLS